MCLLAEGSEALAHECGLTRVSALRGRKEKGWYLRGCGVVVSHALRMRKAPGSNPGTSTIFFFFSPRAHTPKLLPLGDAVGPIEETEKRIKESVSGRNGTQINLFENY